MSAAVAALRSAPPVAGQSGQQSNQSGQQGFPTSGNVGNVSVDPLAADDPWQQYGPNGGVGGGRVGGTGNQFGPSPPAAAAAAMSHGYDASRDRFGRFVLYDEKVHANNKYLYDGKRPEVWLSDVRDYIAGRTRELDALLLWIESCTDEVEADWAAVAYPGCMDCAPMEEVSRQLWSFLGPLVKDHNEKASVFRNVPRHNGLEAWRRITEPINDDKAAMRRELLPKINNPKRCQVDE